MLGKGDVIVFEEYDTQLFAYFGVLFDICRNVADKAYYILCGIIARCGFCRIVLP